MAEQDLGPAGGITPYLTIREGRASDASAFYRRAFGAKELFRQAAQDGKRLMHCHLSINGGSLVLSDDFPEYRGGAPMPEPSGITLHLQVDDADEWWTRAVAAGAEVKMELADQFWGDRYGQLRDPFGHSWSIGAPLRKVETRMEAA